MKQHKASIAASGLTVLYEPNDAGAASSSEFPSALNGTATHTHRETDNTVPASSSSPAGRASGTDMAVQHEAGVSAEAVYFRPAGPRLRLPPARNAGGRVSMATMPRLRPTAGSPLDLRRRRSQVASETSRRPTALQGRKLRVYWPLDLLPISCPNTRILTWGCRAQYARGRLAPAQPNVFSLRRRAASRPRCASRRHEEHWPCPGLRSPLSWRHRCQRSPRSRAGSAYFLSFVSKTV